MRFNKLVSVIIPTYNHAEFILEAIESVKNQSYSSIEIIVVDDGSTDDTAELLSMEQNIKVYYQANKGPSAARNYGLENANGEFICFLDADDIIEPNFLTTQAEFLRNNQKFAFVYCDMASFGRKETRVAKIKPYDPEVLKRHNYIHISSLFRGEVIRQFRFDEKLKIFEDWSLYLSLLEKGYIGFYLDKKLLGYRKHAEMTSLSDRAMSRSRQIWANYIIYRKHRSLYPRGYAYRYLLSEIKADTLRKIKRL